MTGLWLSDYCRRCVSDCGCGRTDTLTEPFQIDWKGPGSMLIARYECAGGHQWLCRWSPELLDGMGD